VKKSLVYQASPYSHPDPAVREARFQEVCRAAAHLMRAGLHVFSPIAHTHPISLAGKLPGDWEYWKSYDEAVLSTCLTLAVLKLDGWEQSKGVQGEVEIARTLKLATYYAGPAAANLDLLAKLIRDDLEEKPPSETQCRICAAREADPPTQWTAGR
jgi:hypothetical protein